MRRWLLLLAMTVVTWSGLLGHHVPMCPVEGPLNGCSAEGGATLTWDLKRKKRVGVKLI